MNSLLNHVSDNISKQPPSSSQNADSDRNKSRFKTTKNQKIIIIGFIKKNPELVLAEYNNTEKQSKLWRELVKKLNSSLQQERSSKLWKRFLKRWIASVKSVDDDELLGIDKTLLDILKRLEGNDGITTKSDQNCDLRMLLKDIKPAVADVNSYSTVEKSNKKNKRVAFLDDYKTNEIISSSELENINDKIDRIQSEKISLQFQIDKNTANIFAAKQSIKNLEHQISQLEEDTKEKEIQLEGLKRRKALLLYKKKSSI